MNTFKATFYGTRGSSPAAGSAFATYGGDTSCLALQVNERIFVLDAGTGIIPLGEQVMAAGIKKLDIFITHAHYDHLQGLPFFTPLMGRQVDISLWFAGCESVESSCILVQKVLSAPFLPFSAEDLKCQLIYRALPKVGSVDLGGGVKLGTMQTNHPGGCTAFRFDAHKRSLVYAPDFEHDNGSLDDALIDFMSEASLAVLDATYTSQEYRVYHGFGHTCWEKSMSLAQRAKLDGWALFHHHHRRPDTELQELERQAHKIDPRAFFARDRLVYDLLQGVSTDAHSEKHKA